MTTPIESVLGVPRQYLPWAECPPSDKCADDLTPSDINVLTHWLGTTRHQGRVMHLGQ